MPQKHQCPKTVPIDDRLPPPFGGVTNWPCVLYRGHDGDCLPEVTLHTHTPVPPPAGPGNLLERLLRAAGEWPDVDDEATGLVSVTNVQADEYAARGVIVVDGHKYRITVRAAGDFNTGGIVDRGAEIREGLSDIPLPQPPARSVHITTARLTLDRIHEAPRNWVFDPPIIIDPDDRYTYSTDGDTCVVAVKRSMAPWDQPMEMFTGRLEWLDATGPTPPPVPDIGDFS